MALLFPRQGPSHFASHAQQTLSSWDACMAKAYCKWPAIIGIIIASVILISILACCFRCLCCGLSFCPCGRRKRTKYTSGPSAFNPAPYQGYQPANSPYGNTPPQFAQFDVGRGNKVHEDSLPAMPSWDAASQKRVLLEEDCHDDVEMGKMEQKAPMLAHQVPSPTKGYAEVESVMPYQQHGARQGGDLGNPYGPSQSYDAPNDHMMPTSPQHDYSHEYLGRQAASQRAYTPYAPSVSTTYEPSSVCGSKGYQGSGTEYGTQPDMQRSDIAQAGRKPGSEF